jgi:antitoxin component of MazEF toxin-antitoxin module
MRATLAKIRRIGNSKGILLPQTILENSGITEIVHISVKDGVIMISPARVSKKKKWSDFKKFPKERADLIESKFDKTEWTW